MTIIRLLPLLAWASAIFVDAARITSFSKSCLAMDTQFYGEDKVGFYCLTQNVEQYEYMYSTIDLRHCVANNLGALVGYNDGDYHESCEDCQLKSAKGTDGSQMGTCHLACECYDMDGHKHKTEIDLSDVLDNADGRLVCYGHGGTRDQVPPECHRNPECDRGKPRLSP